MDPVINLDKEYGIVLEGGGARGAYQAGVWKALKEGGVKIRGISGTSVGALQQQKSNRRIQQNFHR